jgi:hypothetical protein
MEYFTTHPSLEVWSDEEKMTIGIGVICERGECIVIGSDMRATYGTTPVGPNDNCGKVFRLADFPCMACVAGKMSSCHAVISQLVAQIKTLSRKRGMIPRELIMQAIDEARSREIRRLYRWAMETSWGISLREFARGKVPGGKLDSLLLRAGYSLLKGTPLPVEMIMGGFIRGQTMFFRAAQKENLQEESSPGVYVIGTGQVAAMRRLNRRGQHVSMSLPRTLLHLHEAMYAARNANRRHVGRAIGYIVIRQREPKVLFIAADAPVLENWRKVYRGRRNTGSLDDSKVTSLDIYQQLKILTPNKKGIAS